ncbi:MAG: glutamine-hydrolyzing GMP synthase [Planctomycetota bacterium]|nr:glutamine-hydrolyzing GMP synthase [Planctomycetota bacterium]
MAKAGSETVVVVDFGSQLVQLIARRVRSQNVFCRIVTSSASAQEIAAHNPVGIIFSGGPRSCHEDDAPRPDEKIFELGIPILGICYGSQVVCHMFGGRVEGASSRQYGHTIVHVTDRGNPLVHSLPDSFRAWMSHGDTIYHLPEGMKQSADTETAPNAIVYWPEKRFYGVQFHPEVVHTDVGDSVFHNFLYEICGCSGDWKMADFIETTVNKVREVVGDSRVVLGLSGGVDSSVTAMLLAKAIGSQLSCIFVNNGLLRLKEEQEVQRNFSGKFGLDFHYVDAADRFLHALAGVTDPEVKRKRIGHLFIEIFDEEASRIQNVKFLAQGTLYPDVIESVAAHGGPTAKIKSHHNVGGLPEKMNLKLVEPLRELFKDEVREVGVKLGLPEHLVWRHPFPGPGLAVRILGEVTKERCDMLRKADDIFITEIKAAGLYREIWQAFVVLLPVNAVGVMGDERTYENAVVLRAVESRDGMTADWFRMPQEVLNRISNRIINEVKGINRVAYDISSKPPATIEWE